MVDMDHSYFLAPERLQTCLDNLVEKVHILEPPALDGNVKATDSDKISLVNASNAKPIVSPEASLLSEGKMVIAGNFPTINNLWIVLAKDDWKIYLLPQNCVCSTPLKEVCGKDEVHITEKEQRLIAELGRPHFKGQSSGKLPRHGQNLHVRFGVLNAVISHEFNLLGLVGVGVRIEKQNHELDVLIGNETRLLKVSHKSRKHVETPGQRNQDVYLLLFGFPALVL